MPTNTFLSLPTKKQLNITQAAIKEFSNKTFEEAKVTRICEYASIPRRTFYSYFESLEDLYSFVFNALQKDCRNTFPKYNHDFNQYFLNLIESEQGLRELYELLEHESDELQTLCHIAISLSFKRKLNLMTQEAYEEILSTLFNDTQF